MFYCIVNDRKRESNKFKILKRIKMKTITGREIKVGSNKSRRTFTVRTENEISFSCNLSDTNLNMQTDSGLVRLAKLLKTDSYYVFQKTKNMFTEKI